MKYIKTYLLHKSPSDYQIFDSIRSKNYSGSDVPREELEDICISLNDKINGSIVISNSIYDNIVIDITIHGDDIEYSYIKDEVEFICNYLYENYNYSIDIIGIVNPYGFRNNGKDYRYNSVSKIPLDIASYSFKFIFSK